MTNGNPAHPFTPSDVRRLFDTAVAVWNGHPQKTDEEIRMFHTGIRVMQDLGYATTPAPTAAYVNVTEEVMADARLGLKLADAIIKAEQDQVEAELAALDQSLGM